MDVFRCPPKDPLLWLRSRCGTDRDCIPDDRPQPVTLQEAICSTFPWVNKHPTRFVEIWNRRNTRKILTIRGGYFSGFRMARCGIITDPSQAPGYRSEADPFTIDIPGLQDIIKVKDWESKQLRFERFQRFQSAKSAVPEVLQWIPPLLTKLDNAQDMIFTGLALAIPIIRRLGPRLIPGIGLLLTLNDILNLFT